MSIKARSIKLSIINLNNNRIVGIHKGADIKNWNLGTLIKEPIENFYEENKNDKKEINEKEKNKEPIEKLYKENNNKKQNVEMNEKGKNIIDNEDKKEKNDDNKIQNKTDNNIEYLSENYPKCDLSFKVIMIGDSGKIYYFYFIYII